jgi:regulatory protein
LPQAFSPLSAAHLDAGLSVSLVMVSITRVRAAGRARADRSPDAGSGEMRVVVLDDGRRIRVDAEQMARHGLEAGEAIADDLLARLEVRDLYLRAREMAVRLLAVRPRTTAELRTRLRRNGVAGHEIGMVIVDLTAAGYLDDLAFARAWVTGRMASRLCGLRRLRWELRRKGLPPPIIEQAIREALGEEGPSAAEERCARAVIERRLPPYRRLAPEVRIRRLAGLLARRGFASSTIARVLGMAREGGPSDNGNE